jgi:hypothetical protein
MEYRNTTSSPLSLTKRSRRFVFPPLAGITILNNNLADQPIALRDLGLYYPTHSPNWLSKGQFITALLEYNNIPYLEVRTTF